MIFELRLNWYKVWIELKAGKMVQNILMSYSELKRMKA